MSTTTSNLNLKKIDTTQDGSLTFNVDTFLGDNWDKIDAAVGKLANLNTQQKSNLVSAINEILSDVQNIDLSGFLLKNLGNLGSDAKAIIQNLFKYDYANPINKSDNTQYIAECNGLIYAYTATNGILLGTLIIEGHSYNYFLTSAPAVGSGILAYVSKGQSYKGTGTSNILFIPQVLV